MPSMFDLHKAIELRRSDPKQIADHQETLLREHLRQAAKAPFYRKIFSEQGILPEEICLDELSKLPLTSRQDLESAPEDFFATLPEDQVDLALTSGSTGDPVLVPYTVNDLERLAFNEQLSFYGAGIREQDRLLLCVTLDRCFIAGLAYMLIGMIVFVMKPDVKVSWLLLIACLFLSMWSITIFDMLQVAVR